MGPGDFFICLCPDTVQSHCSSRVNVPADSQVGNTLPGRFHDCPHCCCTRHWCNSWIFHPDNLSHRASPDNVHTNAVVYGGQGYKGYPTDSQAGGATSSSGAYGQEQRAAPAHVRPRQVNGQGTVIHFGHQRPAQLNRQLALLDSASPWARFVWSSACCRMGCTG